MAGSENMETYPYQQFESAASTPQSRKFAGRGTPPTPPQPPQRAKAAESPASPTETSASSHDGTRSALAEMQKQMQEMQRFMSENQKNVDTMLDQFLKSLVPPQQADAQGQE